MTKLIHRHCPNCESDRPNLLFQLSLQQFFDANPSYSKKWFDSLGFPNEKKFNFVECDKCKFVYSESRLNRKLNLQFYHEGINAQISLNKMFSLEKRINLISIWFNLLSMYQYRNKSPINLSNKKIKVLDFGAGWGDLLSVAKSPGIEVFGLELNNDKIDYANTIGVSSGDQQFIEHNAPYDVFNCNQVLEHLDKPLDSLRYLKSLLTEESIGFISVPNFTTLKLKQLKRKIKDGKQIIKEINPWGHLNYFTAQSLREMLTISGFAIIRDYSQIRMPVQASNTSRKRLKITKQMHQNIRHLFSKLGIKNKNGNNPNSMSTSVFVRIREK